MSICPCLWPRPLVWKLEKPFNGSWWIEANSIWFDKTYLLSKPADVLQQSDSFLHDTLFRKPSCASMPKNLSPAGLYAHASPSDLFYW